MPDKLELAALSLTISLCLAWYFLSSSGGTKADTPPGPPRHWRYGNLSQFPSEKQWLWYTKLHEVYGPVVRVILPGTELIVLRDLKTIQELFAKRSAIYSDRMRQVMAGEVAGMNVSTFMAPYGEFWKAQRKIWHQHLGPSAVPPYHSMIHRLNLDLIHKLHDGTRDIHEALHQSLVRIMLNVAYGMDVEKEMGEWPERLSTFNNELLAAMTPGKYLVDTYPILKYVPAWFPGASWKRHALQLRQKAAEVADEPIARVRAQMAAGEPQDSVTARVIEQKYSGIAGTAACQKWVMGSIYGAGVDTTQAILRRVLFAMVTRPDVQRRVQEEIDSVTDDGSRLPTHDDVANLPYLDAVVQECFRWQPSLPTGVPHRLMQDDVYDGFLLRKGSMVIPNFWAVAGDPERYTNPTLFNPDRFLGSAPELDPRTYLFGVGRRVCPGKDFADASILSTVSLLLWAYDLTPATDAKGQETQPEFTTSGSFGNDLAPFPCTVKPREASRFSLVHSELGVL